MDNFYKYLSDNKLGDILHNVPFEYQSFSAEQKVYDFLNDLIDNQKRAFVYGDYDADGLYCIKIWMSFLDVFNVSYDVYKYTHRTHALDYAAVIQCIQGKYDYFIVSDTGSSDLKLLKMLSSYGIRVIVIDHHNSIYSYESFPDTVAIVNSVFENQIIDEPLYKMSAAGLVYYVLAKYLDIRNEYEPNDMVIYALISLYSDCMDMKNRLNRAVYFKAMCIEREDLPPNVKLYLNDYSAFRSRFITFRLVPRINAMFRSENLGLINDLYLNKEITADKIGDCVNSIEDIYTSTRSMVSIIADAIDFVELDNFILVNLWDIDSNIKVMENKLYNYTGLIANKLSERYGKTAVVYCLIDDYYKGSVRDVFGRNYRSLFKQLCYAEGHDPAFGIKISYFEFDKFMTSLKLIDKHFSIQTVNNTPKIFEAGMYPDSVMLNDIAFYNEFSGQTLPVAYLRKGIVGDIKGRKTNYYYLYNWGDQVIQSDYKIPFGKNVLLKPICSLSTRLIATTDLKYMK